MLSCAIFLVGINDCKLYSFLFLRSFIYLFNYLFIYLFIHLFIYLFVCLLFFDSIWLELASLKNFSIFFPYKYFSLQQKQKTQVQADGLSKFFKDMLYQFFENTGRGWYLFFFWWWGWFPYVVVELRLMFMDWLLKDILQYLSLWTFRNLRWNNNAVN